MIGLVTFDFQCGNTHDEIIVMICNDMIALREQSMTRFFQAFNVLKSVARTPWVNFLKV